MRWLLLLSLLLAGCSTPGIEQRNGYQADQRHPALGAEPRVKIVVLHYTAESFPASLQVLTDREVSVHYLIPAHPVQRRGQPLVLQLVPETELAWHAGASYWRGATRLNDTSVGIELVNPGYRVRNGQRVWYPFPSPQIAALTPLLKDLVQRYGLRPENIVGHSDVAPLRKQDPGPLFPWAQLAQQGLGAWPDADRVQFWLQGRQPASAVPVDALLNKLAAYGYAVEPSMTPAQQQKLIAAFQMHFRAADFRGLPDAETEAIADALLEKYGRS